MCIHSPYPRVPPADDDALALTELSLMWSDLMELRLVPVIEDAQLAEVLARAGK